MNLSNFGKGEMWLPGWIVKHTSSVSFLICGHNGQTFTPPATETIYRGTWDRPADHSTLETMQTDLPTSTRGVVVGFLEREGHRLTRLCHWLLAKRHLNQMCPQRGSIPGR